MSQGFQSGYKGLFYLGVPWAWQRSRRRTILSNRWLKLNLKILSCHQLLYVLEQLVWWSFLFGGRNDRKIDSPILTLLHIYRGKTCVWTSIFSFILDQTVTVNLFCFLCKIARRKVIPAQQGHLFLLFRTHCSLLLTIMIFHQKVNLSFWRYKNHCD